MICVLEDLKGDILFHVLGDQAWQGSLLRRSNSVICPDILIIEC